MDLAGLQNRRYMILATASGTRWRAADAYQIIKNFITYTGRLSDFFGQSTKEVATG
jgi:hypothetical protein